MTVKKKWKQFWKYRSLTLMAIPAIIYFLVNNYLPMAGIKIAFERLDYRLGIFNSPLVGFENFKYLFASSDAWIIFRNTLGYNFLFMILNGVGAVFTAILLNEITSKKLQKLYQTSMLLPAFLSMTIVGYIVYAFLSPTYGYLNKVTEFLGMEKINAYINPKPWVVIFPVVNFWKNVGYSSIVYLATIVGFDASYYEAASIDGAKRWQQIRYITLPMLKPTIITITLMGIGKMLNADFGLFYQIPLGRSMSTTNVLDTYTYRALMDGQIEKSAAAGLFQSVVGFMLVMITNYITKKLDEESALF